MTKTVRKAPHDWEIATMIVRLPRPLKDDITAAAKEEEMSSAELTRYILRRWHEERMHNKRVMNER